MPAPGQHADPPYRGPDRRGPDRRPPSLEVEAPGGYFWVRAALGGLLVGMCALAVSVLSARGLDDLSTVHATLYLCWCIIALGSGFGFYLRWRLTGEAPIGLLAAALVVMSLPQLPLALVDVAADPNQTWRRLGPMTRLTVMVPAAWLLVRCVRAPEVDSALRPVRLALGYGAVAVAAPLALIAAQSLGLVATPPPLAPSVAGYVIAVLTLGLAWSFGRHTRSIARPLGSRLAVVFAGLAIGALVEVVARRWWPSMVVLSGVVAVVCLGLLVLIAVSLLRTALDFTGLRLLSLSMRADTADDAVRREQERMHELRATVAGIRLASGTLRSQGHRLEPDRERDLQEMMTAELGRLERLLGRDRAVAEHRPVLLDDLIRPLAVCQREQGANVRWRPTGAAALVDADAVTEVLNILLTNACMHAPGSAVEILVSELSDVVRVVVRDEGPGVPPQLAQRLFVRGARRADSPGDGLGLHIAHRLAADSGGTLALLSAPDGRGAHFALTLRAAPTAAHAARIYPLEEAG